MQGKQTRQPLSVFVSFRVRPDERRALDRLAAADGQRVSEKLRDLLRQAAEKRGQLEPAEGANDE